MKILINCCKTHVVRLYTLYSGEYFDKETGTVYLRARYYSPATSRMLSEDNHWNQGNMIYGDKKYKEGEIKNPDINAIMQSTNLYVYCGNNPVSYVDPTGHFAFVIPIAIGAAEVVEAVLATAAVITTAVAADSVLESSRSANKLQPNPEAVGDHSTWKVDPITGKVKNYETWTPNTNPKNPRFWDSNKRYDGRGREPL